MSCSTFFAIIIIIAIVDHMVKLHFAPADTIHQIKLYEMDSAILVSPYLSTKWLFIGCMALSFKQLGPGFFI